MLAIKSLFLNHTYPRQIDPCIFPLLDLQILKFPKNGNKTATVIGSYKGIIFHKPGHRNSSFDCLAMWRKYELRMLLIQPRKLAYKVLSNWLVVWFTSTALLQETNADGMSN